MASPTRTLPQPPARSPARRDPEAFTRAYAEHHAALHRYCRAILRNEHDAQDALQNAATKAYAAWQCDPQVRQWKPWLFRIAHNEAISLVRARRGVEPVAEVPEVVGDSLATVAERRERLAHLDTDLAALPEKQRAALVLRELNGLGHDEIAAVLGGTARSIKQTIYEARVALLDSEEGRAMTCGSIQQALSDGDGRVRRGRRMRGHLRTCKHCRGFAGALERRPGELAALAPALSPGAAAALLAQVLGGGAAAAGTGAALGGGGAAGSGAALGAAGSGAALGGAAGSGAALGGSGAAGAGAGSLGAAAAGSAVSGAAVAAGGLGALAAKGAIAVVLGAAAIGGGVAVQDERSSSPARTSAPPSRAITPVPPARTAAPPTSTPGRPAPPATAATPGSRSRPARTKPRRSTSKPTAPRRTGRSAAAGRPNAPVKPASKPSSSKAPTAKAAPPGQAVKPATRTKAPRVAVARPAGPSRTTSTRKAEPRKPVPTKVRESRRAAPVVAKPDRTARTGTTK